ncbi:YqiJ family protein [Psychrosphaera sp. B3R10]|uniref:OB-fold-containig protein n=1 Tax=unclassified Psychrosphaera TaxID=2641570 RepID=UPI001C0981F4|nr:MULTISPECIES: OB-fold-containig protein [unclassified Psychrosphaera]MBU2882962.1 YqiJ family protein [Psychrosphaera sp. I2R16]MBU2991359.1 YqiJ family protein [Psychrosphaera sp. B3R10]
MSEFLFASFNSYYTIALSIVLILLFIELAGQLVGFSFSHLFDSGADIDTTASLSGSASVSLDILGWLGLKKLPLLIWLVSFLTVFAIVGYCLSYFVFFVLDVSIAKLLAGGITLVISLFLNSKVCTKLAEIMPKEESSAVSKESFAGLLANITVGTAKLGQPAEAMIRDEFNQKHYVLVEPIEEDEFSQGENVVLVVKEGSRWLVTRFD